MHGSNEWIGAQNLQRLLRVDQRMVVHQRGLVRARLALRVAGRAVPGAGHDALVARDRAVLDLHPMPERAARRVEEPVPCAFAGHEDGSHFSPAKVLVSPLLIRSTSRSYHVFIAAREQHGLHAARRRAAERGEQRRGPDLEPVQHLLHHRADVLVSAGETHQHAREGTDFHRLAVVPGRLHPGVLLGILQVGPGRRRAGVFRLRLALVRDAAPPHRPSSTRTTSW